MQSNISTHLEEIWKMVQSPWCLQILRINFISSPVDFVAKPWLLNLEAQRDEISRHPVNRKTCFGMPHENKWKFNRQALFWVFKQPSETANKNLQLDLEKGCGPADNLSNNCGWQWYISKYCQMKRLINLLLQRENFGNRHRQFTALPLQPPPRSSPPRPQPYPSTLQPWGQLRGRRPVNQHCNIS